MTVTVQRSEPAVQLQVSWLSHQGLVRSHNEDAVLAEYPVFVVADGMGGHDAGDIASAQVVELFRSLVGRHQLTAVQVLRVITSAHQRITQLASLSARGAGTTLSGVAVVQDAGRSSWLFFNIGDSRVYRLYAGQLEQVTVDHSVAQELHESGRSASGYRNVITRALGDAVGDVDYWLMPIRNGERLLICSDGLSGELSRDAMQSQLLYGGPADSTAQALLELTLQQGARDNVSLIVLDVRAGGQNLPGDTETRVGGYELPALSEQTNDAAMEFDSTQTIEIPGRAR